MEDGVVVYFISVLKCLYSLYLYSTLCFLVPCTLFSFLLCSHLFFLALNHFYFVALHTTECHHFNVTTIPLLQLFLDPFSHSLTLNILFSIKHPSPQVIPILFSSVISFLFCFSPLPYRALDDFVLAKLIPAEQMDNMQKILDAWQTQVRT